MKRASGLSLQIAAVLLMLQGGASSASAAELRSPPPGQTASASAPGIQALFYSNDAFVLALSATDLRQLRSLYAERGFEPIWSGSDDAQQRAEIMHAVLARADTLGLNPADYAIKKATARGAGPPSAKDDIEFTQVVFRYARDVATGRLPPNAIYRDVGLPEKTFDPVAAFTTALHNRDISSFLGQLSPPHEEYRRLVSALAQYRALEAQGGWPAIPASSEIKIGSDDPRLEPLIRRLKIEDSDLAATGEGDLLAAVKRYQLRNGLAPDGRVGRSTLEMLNVSASERVAQIVANMERWRWLPRTFESRYIAINVPDRSLRFIENGQDVLFSRVIVGQPRTPTPIFRANAVAVTANPPWNVPYSIAVKEILPKLKRDPNYLVSQNMILVNGPAGDPSGTRVDWRKMTASEFPYRVQQLPGANNALGNLKLELPNDFNVYLHDTPGRAAFGRDQRALSHGCIRVQQVLPLAAIALGGDRQAALDSLQAAIATGMTQQIKLNDPLPVYVLYWTAMAENDGTVSWRQDLYNRDRRLTAVLSNRVVSARLAMYTGECEVLPG